MSDLGRPAEEDVGNDGERLRFFLRDEVGEECTEGRFEGEGGLEEGEGEGVREAVGVFGIRWEVVVGAGEGEL